MIKIKIKSDVPMVDPHFDIIHAAARELADATGQSVEIISRVVVMPKDEISSAVEEILSNTDRPAARPLSELFDIKHDPSGADHFAVDWSKAPANALSHAFDKDGAGWWYGRNANELVINPKHFSGDAFLESGYKCISDDWQSSPRQRPQPAATFSTSEGTP